jgi:cholesterol transport system auxiliary component
MKRASGLATSALAISAVLLAGCVGMQPPQAEAPTLYVLEARPAERPARPLRDVVLAVSVPRARAGYDTAQMAYVREPFELDYFTKSRWADTPARMLAPLLVQALEQAGGFRAVVQAPSAIPADLRLDTELVRLQQNFRTRPPQVELALRAQLVDVRSSRVLATAEFEEVESAPREDAYGGVIAANRALQRLLARLADFAAEQSGGR